MHSLVAKIWRRLGRLEVIGLSAIILLVVTLTMIRLLGVDTRNSTNEGGVSPTAWWLGDSFTEGTGADNDSTAFPAQVCRAYGWRCTNVAEGATGYVANGAVAQFPQRRPIPGHIAAAAEARPNVLIVAAGINDTRVDVSQVRIAAHETFARLQVSSPASTLIVVGPFWPDGHPGPSILAVRDAIRLEANLAGLHFTDPIGEEWITGRRGEYGDALLYTGADRTHPTQAGHNNIAHHLLIDLEPLDLPRGPTQPG